MIARDLLTIDQLTAEEFRRLLDVATYLKERQRQGLPEQALGGRTLAMVFEKPSLRTRVSFEVGMTQLGGRGMYIGADEVGLGKRETVADVARVLSRFVDGIMLRTFKHSTVVELAQHATVPVINGLSDEHHPCQALGDFLTIREHFGRIDGHTVVFIGDANNVSRSLARACLLAGSRFVLACPAGYAFGPADQQSFGAAWGREVTQVHDPVRAVAGAHVLYTDVWTSMGQEAEREQRLRDFDGYRIDDALLSRAAPGAKVMHCLPAHRGEEISHDAMEGAASIVFDQAENRLHAQKAVLRIAIGRDRDAFLARFA
jgi:ornithine carbamoyltransferase